MSFPQVTRYIGIYSKDSGFKVVPCNRYSGEKNGAKVISVTDWCVTVCLTVGREHLGNVNTGVPQTCISDFVVVLYWQNSVQGILTSLSLKFVITLGIY